MSRIPEPTRTEEGLTYEGRVLARPEDEVVDQGASFDAATLVSRRRLFGLVGLGAGALTLAACSATTAEAENTPSTSSTDTSTDSSTETSTDSATASPTETTDTTTDITAVDSEVPDETNGPYPADGTNGVNVLEESGIVRSDITSSLDGGVTAEGVPFTLTMLVTDLANDNVPFAGAAVYIWQCDAAGLYSMYSQGVEDETYLRGIQVADDAGEVTFTSIVPGCYQGRWTHIHFEVYPDVDSATDVANAIATSQIAFPSDMLSGIYELDAYSGSAENLAGVGTQISDDDIFGEGDWELQVPTVTGDIDSGYAGTLAVAIDTTTEPSSDMGGGGQGGGGAPDGGGGPGGDGGNGP